MNAEVISNMRCECNFVFDAYVVFPLVYTNFLNHFNAYLVVRSIVMKSYNLDLSDLDLIVHL